VKLGETPPAPTKAEIEKLLAVAPRYGVEIVAPPATECGVTDPGKRPSDKIGGRNSPAGVSRDAGQIVQARDEHAS
jgi:hypothetical protein